MGTIKTWLVRGLSKLYGTGTGQRIWWQSVVGQSNFLFKVKFYKRRRNQLFTYSKIGQLRNLCIRNLVGVAKVSNEQKCLNVLLFWVGAKRKVHKRHDNALYHSG